MKKPRLEKWRPYYDGLAGYVYNHPKNIADGTYVVTSQLVELDEANNRAKTRNTEYELGERSPELYGTICAKEDAGE